MSKDSIYEAMELPQLTDTQYNFVTEWVRTGKAKQAYLTHFAPQEALTDCALTNRVGRLTSNPNIKRWADALRTEACTVEGYTLAAHIKEMEEMRQAALAAGNVTAAITASSNKAKAAGFYSSSTINIAQNDDQSILDVITAILGPDMATEAARRMGYPVKEQMQ